jgi:hypothetical protein
MLTIVHNPNAPGAELGKRQYVPGYVLDARCPECKAPWTKDLETEYVTTYAVSGDPIEVHCCCDSCDHEWVEPTKVRYVLTVELVPESAVVS